jgi:6-phosphogluconolactonase
MMIHPVWFSTKACALLALSLVLASCGGGIPSSHSRAPQSAPEVLYLFTAPNKVQIFPIDTTTGALGSPTSITVPVGGGAVATPDLRFLYISDSKNHQIDGFNINPETGVLTPISESPFPSGSNTQAADFPNVDPAGKFLYVSDFFGSDIVAFNIDSSTGSLSPISGSPFNSGFYPAKVVISPSDSFAEVVDAGIGFGGISSYALNSTNGVLTPGVSGPLTFVSSAGAEDIVMHSNGKFLYISQGFTTADSGVAAFTIDQTTGFPTPMVNAPFTTGLSPARMATDPATKFLYTANTGDGTISGFSIDSTTGTLTKIPGSPLSFGINPPPPGGLLPFDLAVDPSAQFLYATNPQTSSISAFRIAASTGALTAVGNTSVSNTSVSGRVFGGILALKLP